MLCNGGQLHGHACQNGDTCREFIYNHQTKSKDFLDTGGICTSTHINVGQVLTKATVDALFAFSTPLSLDYTGLWLSSSSFEITITQLFPIQLESETVQQIGSVAPTPARIYPAVGCATCVNAHEFVAYVRKEAALSNVPIACLPQFATSLPLDGDFGGAVVQIDYVIADDPGNVNDFYSPGDTITIVFNMATNMAGMPATNIPKQQIDSIMQFSEHIGTDYVGNWRCGSASRNLCKEYEISTDASGKEVSLSRWALEITLLDITGVRGLESCPDTIGGCDLVALDLAGFTVSLLPQGPYPAHVWASNFSTGGPGIRNFPAQCGASSHSFKGMLGRFGRLLQLFSIVPSRLPARGGYITITGRGFGWNPKTLSITIGGRVANDIRLPSGWTYPVPQLLAQSVVALAPPGTGARGSKVTVYLQDEFSPDKFSTSLDGLVFYAAPMVSGVEPSQLRLAALQAFEDTQFLLTIRGVNFGSNVRHSTAEVAPQVLIYTLTDGVHACPNVTHLSDELLTCVHSVSSRMRTGGSSANVVVEVDGQESGRDSLAARSCKIEYQAVPAFWHQCTSASTRECVECCEFECIEQVEADLDMMANPEPVWDRCKLTCFDFCGLTKVQWHTNSDASQEL